MALSDLLSSPVVVAPMAGGPTTPALVAAAASAGAFGFLAAGYKTVAALFEEISAVRAAGVAVFGEGTKLAITHASQPGLEAGARWAVAGGVGAFALSLAAIHVGAEWTSLRDRSFLGRICLAGVAIALAVAGGGLVPFVFVGLVCAAVLAQLLLEAFTPRFGAATVYEPSVEAAAPSEDT